MKPHLPVKHAIVLLSILLSASRLMAAGVACRVEIDRQTLPANQQQTAVVKITLDAPEPIEPAERPPVNLCIVLDRSGSMSGQKLEKAKEAAIEALRRLGGRDIFSLVIYDHNVNTLVPAQSARNTNSIEQQIRAIESGGNTALFGGVSQGAAEIRKHADRDYFHRIILLSDGLANVGPSSPADLERLGAALIKENISVTSVGVGTDYNEDLMTRLSQASDGNSYFVENSRDLPRIFAAEIGDVLSVVAREVVIEIKFKNGVTPIRIIGRDGKMTDTGVELGLNQLYGGQEKYALVEVSVPPAKPDEVREIAVANIRYQDAVTQEALIARADVSVRFSLDEQQVISSANPEVQHEYARNVIAMAKDKSVDLMDHGSKSAAVANLRQVREQLQQTAEQYGYDLDGDLAELEEQAEKLEKDGMGKADRKRMRTDSYQIRNQQK